MKRRLQSGVLFLIAATIIGCGGSSNEQLFKDMVATMNEIADAMDKSKTAAEAKPKLETLVNKLKDVKSRAEKAKGTKSEEEALLKKYQPEIAKAADRLFQATMSLGQRDPVGVKELGPMFEALR